MNFMFDFKGILDKKIESEMLKNKQVRPLVKLAQKYGIKGMQIMSFIADLATAAQELAQIQQEEADQ